MQEHEIKEAIRAIDKKRWWKKRDSGTYLDVSPQLEQGWFPLANQWAELLSKSKLNGSQFRLVFWWFRNAYGRMRKIMAHWPGAKKVGLEIGMNEDQVKHTLAGMCRAGMFKRKGDEIYLVKNWLTWDMWKWIENIPENTYPQNPQSYPQPSHGTNPPPPLGDESVPQKGTNQSPDINKVVKERKKDTRDNESRGSEIGLLIAEFQIALRNKLKEAPTGFNRGAAARGFKKLLGSYARHDIQTRFNAWFESNDAYVEMRSWRVEDFFMYFHRLKTGSILARLNDRNAPPRPPKTAPEKPSCDHCNKRGWVILTDDTNHSHTLACICLNSITGMKKWNGQPMMFWGGRTLRVI